MSLGSKNDKIQECTTEDVTEITLNLDQAIVLHQAMISLTIESKTKKQALKRRKKEINKFILTQPKLDSQRLEINEHLRLVSFTESKIPYLVESINEAIVYLQKELDSIIKGVQS